MNLFVFKIQYVYIVPEINRGFREGTPETSMKNKYYEVGLGTEE